MRAFQDAKRPLRVQEICETVNLDLGSEVPRSSVRSYLNLNAGPEKTFERTEHGTYKLRI
jgi:hypothetical protein